MMRGNELGVIETRYQHNIIVIIGLTLYILHDKYNYINGLWCYPGGGAPKSNIYI